MSERQHTPGPWVKRQFPTAANACCQYWVMDSISDVAGKVVANSICKVMPTNPDEDANADLIAAAPDLLEACEQAHAKLEYLVNLWGSEAITKRVFDLLGTAIAKAKGHHE